MSTTSVFEPFKRSAAHRISARPPAVQPARDEIDHLSDVLEGRHLPRVEADTEGGLCGNEKLDVHERVPALDVMRRRRRRDGQSGVVEDILEHAGQSSPDLILVHELALVVPGRLKRSVEAPEPGNVGRAAGAAIGRLVHEHEPEPRIVVSDEGVLRGGTVDALGGGKTPLAGSIDEMVADELL